MVIRRQRRVRSCSQELLVSLLMLIFDIAYESFVKLYNIVGSISHEDFQNLIDTSNPASQLLLSHFLAAHILLRHVSFQEMTTVRSFNDPFPMYHVMMSWMQHIDSNLPPSYLKYNNWPRTYVCNWTPILASGLWRPSIGDLPIQRRSTGTVIHNELGDL